MSPFNRLIGFSRCKSTKVRHASSNGFIKYITSMFIKHNLGSGFDFFNICYINYPIVTKFLEII